MKYKDEFTNEISFPLGGIGTGSIGLGGNGRLMDWEIFNRPNKGSINGYSHFAIKTETDGKPVTKIINGDLTKDLSGQYEKRTDCGGFGYGPDKAKMCGYPHFRDVDFCGEFPIATLNFRDDGFPADVKLTAFNPFIPNDEDNSGIPAAFFEFQVTNKVAEEKEYQIALSVENPFAVSENKPIKINNCSVLNLANAGDAKDSVNYGDLSIATDCDNVHIQSYWYRGAWQDKIVSYWNDFNAPGYIKPREYSKSGTRDTGTLTAAVKISANSSKKVRFVISWNIPNNYNYWNEYMDENGNHVTWQNYYATRFKSSSASACYALENWDGLFSRTEKFKNILHNSTFSESVIDAVTSNLSVLKSPTVYRLEDGSFYGFEGVNELAGSCEGTCQHVWNYAYALCFLFPRLERSIRNTEFKYSTAEDGRTGFRLMLPLGRGITDFRPCVDGQMGIVFKSYREWKLSKNNDWLKSNWETIKKILEYAWCDTNYDKWDRDKDGVLEGRQHHTLDMEMFAPSSWLEGLYLLALKAASEMATELGDTEKAKEYTELYLKGKKWTEENLFNGKYFIQKIDVTDKNLTDAFGASDTYWNDEVKEIKYQIADGSSIDQMLAQWHADIIGLGDIFNPQQVDTALCEMMKNNYKETMRDFANPWRVFSLNDEAGSVICVYPEGSEKPKIPIPYCEETMTGFEYSFAGLLMSRKKYSDGEKVVKAVRDRFDGKKRNPWNEFECGSNYARSMASYALVPVLSGFTFDLPKNHIGFNPYNKDNFHTLWSVDGAWGEIEVCGGNRLKLTVCEGEITLSSFGAEFMNNVSSLKIDGKAHDFTFSGGKLNFEKTAIKNTLEIV